MKIKIDTEKLEKVLSGLKGKTIVVEGLKDARALEALGIENESIVMLNGKPLFEVVSSLRGKIVILTDFDRTGNSLAGKLRRLSQGRKISANQRLRKEIGTFVRNVEELKKLSSASTQIVGQEEAIKNRRGGNYVKTSANVDKIHSESCDKGEWCNRETGCNRCDFWAD